MSELTIIVSNIAALANVSHPVFLVGDFNLCHDECDRASTVIRSADGRKDHKAEYFADHVKIWGSFINRIILEVKIEGGHWTFSTVNHIYCNVHTVMLLDLEPRIKIIGDLEDSARLSDHVPVAAELGVRASLTSSRSFPRWVLLHPSYDDTLDRILDAYPPSGLPFEKLIQVKDAMVLAIGHIKEIRAQKGATSSAEKNIGLFAY